ncbi:MAG TPA: hypothetical protein VM737_04400 [Gemmatimonadota bacterium]|nr:hypothetical protein [Gemmatimonadota bacterium]
MRQLKRAFVVLAAVWSAGCGEQSVPTASPQAGEVTLTASPTHGVDLTCFAGPCGGAAGTVNMTQNARPVAGAAPGFGVALVGEYTVHGAPPNTTYLVQRAFDPILDGVCTGAFISWPFLPFQPPGPDPVRLTTSAGGAGAAHFSLEIPFAPEGVHLDFVFRLIEESPNPGGTELRTACVQD